MTKEKINQLFEDAKIRIAEIYQERDINFATAMIVLDQLKETMYENAETSQQQGISEDQDRLI